MSEENAAVLPPETAKALAAFRDALVGLQAAGLVPDMGTGTVAAAQPTVASADGITPVEVQQAEQAKRPIAPSLVGEFIDWFIKSSEEHLYDVKRGQWECRIGYRNSDEDKRAHVLVFHSKVQKRGVADDVICVRPVGSELAIFNASRITYGTSMSAQKQPQQIAEDAGAVPVPFENVVARGDMDNGTAGAGMDLSKLEIVDWTGAEDLFIPPVARQRWTTTSFQVIKRHFAGAVVLRVTSQYFLFDTDREEASYHGFNPFFTQLPRPVSSVEDAYRALMPDVVAMATEAGETVVRQGEFFFVAANDDEVRDALVDAENPMDVFFYNQVRDRLVECGAAVINCANRTQLLEVEQFIGKCTDNNGGRLDGSDDVAELVLEEYCTFLQGQAGPMSAAYYPEREEPDGTRNAQMDGTAPGRTHLPHIAEELEARLDFADEERNIRRRRTGRNRNSDSDMGPDGHLGIRFDVRIGSDDTGRGVGRTQNQHLAIGVLELSGGVTYAIGAVLHQGREHRPVFLNGWHRVYSNTATNNWTVSGDVD